MPIPFEIKSVLTLPMIGLYVYPEFRRIGFDTIKLHQEFTKDFKASGGRDEVAYFLDYGVRVLNLMLNQKLNRPIDHPSFLWIVEHGISDYIQRDQNVWRTRNQLGKGAYFYGCELTY